MWLVIVDEHSKWPEVLPFRSTTAQATVASLHTVFARYGCPEELVSDNGPQFVAAEFEAFLRANGIRHRTSAPYHPATNELAERFVQSFKRAMKAFPDAMPCQAAADKFLISYRNTVHPTTGETPSNLLMGRRLRTRLDLLRPDVRTRVAAQQTAQQKSSPSRKVHTFQLGESVLVQDYRKPNKPSWIPATVSECYGMRSYVVETADGGSWRRHIDQIRPGHPTFTTAPGREEESETVLRPEHPVETAPATVAPSVELAASTETEAEAEVTPTVVSSPTPVAPLSSEGTPVLPVVRRS
ncbi:uncharacterized protein K02A2.6-like [Sycon ciliatum]|uniref:uncharacterized protein K02A2.6-like n=1 Tax=Sycon ciliatum TaxID=27933 RepID=UPI0031F70B08